MCTVDEGEEEDDQSDDDGHGCSCGDDGVQQEADVLSLWNHQSLISGWSWTCGTKHPIHTLS